MHEIIDFGIESYKYVSRRQIDHCILRVRAYNKFKSRFFGFGFRNVLCDTTIKLMSINPKPNVFEITDWPL